MLERNGLVTVHGKPLTLQGNALKTGDSLPVFTLVDNELNEVSSSALKGKIKIFSVVPSLDTPVCDLQTQRFEAEAAGLPGDVGIYTVSMDLPFAQKRYCGAHAISKIKTLSDHKYASFGAAFGVLVKETRLLARSIFIVSAAGRISYVEIVKELSEHPDYIRALQELKKNII
ncbi:MAG: thiol peroxidase [Candidatus Firestonebacteria bacterium]